MLQLNCLKWLLILIDLSEIGVTGMCGVTVKCIDITQNTDRESRLLSLY